MEYITSGDRIAVENFEIGFLYKVTFLNETEVYFMCCGIGKDFVMLMSNEPRLFSLTMLSAAEVDAIDEYTPLPPPTPPTNLLQYQTGEPPFTFTTTDTELFSWYIKGPAGDKTANLLGYNRQRSNSFTTDENYYIYGGAANSTSTDTSPSNVSISISDNTISVYSRNGSGIGYIVEVQPNTTYTLSFDSDLTLPNKTYAALNLLTEGLQFGTLQTVYDKTYSFTTDNTTKYVYIVFRVVAETCVYSNIMLNTGNTALPYEHYGYKIPILCNATLSNIYINEALGENDILYSTDTTYTIATELGDNLLQVQGETQPSLMQIVYKWEFEG